MAAQSVMLLLILLLATVSIVLLNRRRILLLERGVLAIASVFNGARSLKLLLTSIFQVVLIRCLHSELRVKEILVINRCRKVH